MQELALRSNFGLIIQQCEMIGLDDSDELLNQAKLAE